MRTNYKILFSLLFSLTMSSVTLAQDTLSVLFIGNSFTFMNDMPDLFKGIAESNGKKVYVQKSVKQGTSLEYHANTPDTYKAIRSRKWDVIVLQEQSNIPAQPESMINKISLPYAKQLTDSIRRNNECTKIFLYMTWGYKDGNSHWKEIATYPAMQERIYSTYLRYADILNVEVSPVGAVWQRVRSSYPGLNLYYSDNQHPSLLGSYLSACTFYCSIFGESVYGSNFTGKVDKHTAEMIQLASSQVVLNSLSSWRIVYDRKPLRPAFDMVIDASKVKFYNRAENAYSVKWEFSDGTESTELDPLHNFHKKGKYTVKQIVSNQCSTKVLERTISIN